MSRSPGSEWGRSPKPFLRWLRFLFFGGLVGAGLNANAQGILLSLRILSTPTYWAPTVPCLGCALAIVALATGYATWLSGATFGSWRMPTWTHLLPIGLFAATFLSGPLNRAPDPSGAGQPPERLRAAMQVVQRGGASARGSPCSSSLAELERALNAPGVAPSGYRRFGWPMGYRVRKVEGAGAVKEPRPGDRPGSIYLACDPGGQRYWISAVASDSLPAGAPTMLADGVGRPVVLTSEVAP